MVGQIDACKMPPKAVVVVVPDENAKKKVMAQIEAEQEDKFEKSDVKPKGAMISDFACPKMCCKIAPNDVRAWIEVLKEAVPVIILTQEAIARMINTLKPKKSETEEDIKEAA